MLVDKKRRFILYYSRKVKGGLRRMLIANPIYDTVFKYLMENLDIAKGIISTMMN